MSKVNYADELKKFHPDTIDELRTFVAWLDKVTAESSTGFTIGESEVYDNLHIFWPVFLEHPNEITPEQKEIVEVMRLLKARWGIFLATEKRKFMKFNARPFLAFKSALALVLKQQPYGYEKTLLPLPQNAKARLIREASKVSIAFGKEKPIYIARENEKQGKLLLLLGYPSFGIGRSIEAVARELGGIETERYLAKNAHTVAIKNAVREVQRKLARKGKRNALGLKLDNNRVWLEVR